MPYVAPVRTAPGLLPVRDGVGKVQETIERMRTAGRPEIVGGPAGRGTASGVRRYLLARTELLEGDGDDRERLVVAARLVRPVLPAESFPWSRLFSDGEPDAAVARMDDPTFRFISDSLWRLCSDAGGDDADE